MNGPEARPGLHAAAAGERAYDLVSLGACRVELWSERAGGDSIAGVQAARHAFASILDRVDVLLPSLPSDSVLWEDAAAAAHDVACSTLMHRSAVAPHA